VAIIADGASINSKAQKIRCKIAQPFRKSPEEPTFSCCFQSTFYPGRLTYFCFDFVHLWKCLRNCLSYSRQNEAENGTKTLLLWHDALGKLVEVFWDAHLRDPFIKYQGEEFRAAFFGLSEKMFFDVENNRTKMNAASAAAIFSKKCQLADECIIELLQTQDGGLDARDDATILALQALQPLKVAVNDFIDVANGVNQKKTRELGGKGKVRERVNYESLAHRDVLRRLPELMARGLAKVREQKIPISGHETPPTEGYNYLTYQTLYTANVTGYGLASLIEYYTKHLRPGTDIFLANFTSDYCERHFANLKRSSEHTIHAFGQAESRCAAAHANRTDHLIATGEHSNTRRNKQRQKGTNLPNDSRGSRARHPSKNVSKPNIQIKISCLPKNNTSSASASSSRQSHSLPKNVLGTKRAWR
jgi:hypothetical protein